MHHLILIIIKMNTLGTLGTLGTLDTLGTLGTKIKFSLILFNIGL